MISFCVRVRVRVYECIPFCLIYRLRREDIALWYHTHNGTVSKWKWIDHFVLWTVEQITACENVLCELVENQNATWYNFNLKSYTNRKKYIKIIYNMYIYRFIAVNDRFVRKLMFPLWLKNSVIRCRRPREKKSNERENHLFSFFKQK